MGLNNNRNNNNDNDNNSNIINNSDSRNEKMSRPSAFGDRPRKKKKTAKQNHTADICVMGCPTAMAHALCDFPPLLPRQQQHSLRATTGALAETRGGRGEGAQVVPHKFRTRRRKAKHHPSTSCHLAEGGWQPFLYMSSLSLFFIIDDRKGSSRSSRLTATG